MESATASRCEQRLERGGVRGRPQSIGALRRRQRAHPKRSGEGSSEGHELDRCHAAEPERRGEPRGVSRQQLKIERLPRGDGSKQNTTVQARVRLTLEFTRGRQPQADARRVQRRVRRQLRGLVRAFHS